MLRSFRRAVATVAAAAPVLVALASPAHAAAPGITVADLRVTETNAGQTATATLRLSARAATSVTVKVATAAGTAKAPADFTALPLTTVTFSPGQTAKTVALKIAGDVLDEYDETFRLVLSSPVRATLARAAATVTIADNDSAPVLALPAAALAEGSDGLADRTTTATINAVSGKPVTLRWETVGGTAASGVDYEPADGTVTIAPGATSAQIPVTLDGDRTDEPDERFYVRLTGVTNASYVGSYQRVTVTDDDLPRTPALDAFVPATGADRLVALTGTADPDTTLRVYGAAACAGQPVLTAAASRLPAGIDAPVAANALTTFSADSVSPRGETSACSNAVGYTHATPPPPPPPAPRTPVLDAITPEAGAATLVTLYGLADPDATLRVYAGPACAGEPLTTAAGSRLGGSGVPVPVVTPDVKNTYSADSLSAQGVASACSNTASYVHATPAAPQPRTPVLDQLVPAAGRGTLVTLFGSAEQDAVLRVYAAEGCAGEPVLTATASRLGSGGVQVEVAENATTTLSVDTLSPGGAVSACSNAVTYLNDVAAPAAPVLTVPAGPANDNVPVVTGTAEPGSTVSLYRGVACAGDPVATGTAAALAEGLAGLVDDDTTTAFSARARDALGNVSACGASTVSYVEDSTAPVATGVYATSPGVGNARVVGTVEAGAVVTVVQATADSAHTCGVALLSGGTAAQLAATVAVPTPRGTTTWLRVLATDAAGNTTPCATAPLARYDDLTTEVEPNNSAATAGAGPSLPNAGVEHFGEVGAVGDVDYYRVNINETGTSFNAETFMPYNGTVTCASNKLDTKLYLYDAAGTLVAQDDDSGEGFCSRMVRTNLAPGVYSLVVTHTSAFSHTTLPYPFAYRLGTAYFAPPSFPETEPNDQLAEATQLGTFSGLGLDGVGALSIGTDVDHYAFTIGTTRTTTVEVFDTGNGACAANLLDSQVTLYNSAGTVVGGPDDDSGGGLCSKITVASLPAGTYTVAVARSLLAASEHTFGYRLGVR